MATFLLFLRTLLALAIVLGLVWGLARLSRRTQGGGGRRAARLSGDGQGVRITVITKRSVSRSASIAVVRVGDRDLVVGATPQNVTLITELPAQVPDLQVDGLSEATNDTPWKATSRQSPMAWDAVITTLRERTTRH